VELATISDDRVVVAARDSIAREFPGADADRIEKIVAEELAIWREQSRVQTFVPVFAQRSARTRVRVELQSDAA
jgi:hypothetical protein